MLHLSSTRWQMKQTYSEYEYCNSVSDSCVGLKDVRVVVPTAILREKTATLFCHFDLEGDSLYSVKWYKGRREFYRYTPKEDPAMKVFPILGMEVEVSKLDVCSSSDYCEYPQTENSQSVMKCCVSFDSTIRCTSQQDVRSRSTFLTSYNTCFTLLQIWIFPQSVFLNSIWFSKETSVPFPNKI